MSAQWAASWLCSLLDVLLEVVHVRSWWAAHFFHHECKIIWFCPMVSLHFVPRKISPLIQLQATLLSPHSCTVGPSSRVWMVLSLDPILWVSFSWTSGLHLSFLFSCVPWGASFYSRCKWCTPPCKAFHHGINHRILFFIACPLHSAPHTFRNSVVQKRQFHLHQ